MQRSQPCQHVIGRTFLPYLAAALAALAVPVVAQTYPAKTVRLVVPYPPGGTADTVARAVGQKLSELWGHSLVVDNRPGAATAIGAELVARSTPDGHTLLVAANQTLAINQNLFRNLGYNPARDFVLLGGLAAAKHILIVHASVPARSLVELISYAKANENKLSYGSIGNASPSHLNMELFKTMAGLSIVHVPYKGGAPAMTDIVGGHVQMMLINIWISLPHIKAGRLKVIAIASDARSPLIRGTPTFAEAGLAGFESNTWWGLVAPVGTARPIVDKISADVAAVVNLPEIRDQKLLGAGLEPFAPDPKQFARIVKRDTEKFARLIRQTGATAD